MPCLTTRRLSFDEKYCATHVRYIFEPLPYPNMAYYHYWNHSNFFSQNEHISEDYCTSSNNNNYGIQYQEEPEIEYGSYQDQLLYAEAHVLDEYVRMPNHNLETEYGSLEDQLLYTKAYALEEYTRMQIHNQVITEDNSYTQGPERLKVAWEQYDEGEVKEESPEEELVMQDWDVQNPVWQCRDK